ncbi:FAD dependent oxidoreductase [Hygrophoropsis aurantiaca]|uniref:FAD dependent oxidoreductase n=1 Tax=Hygrophoropsis aurantiaca TaxID=72124 RepID=A0ACB8ACE5_9AGAM|nr:FAD dependent oxidoreductase [Hygrophoropsis aurantiaca]
MVTVNPTHLTCPSVVIVGAGTFGLSTAAHLLERGYTDVTVLDRAPVLPAQDAASTDINKVVRSCYTDRFYTALARRAIEAWKGPEWEGCYHESGILLVRKHPDPPPLPAAGLGDGAYSSPDLGDVAYENDRALGARTTRITTPASIRAALAVDTAYIGFGNSLLSPASHTTLSPPTSSPKSSPTTYSGSHNLDGGWAEAARAVSVLLARVRAQGGKVWAGCEVRGLVWEEDVVGGSEGVGGEGRAQRKCVGVRVLRRRGDTTHNSAGADTTEEVIRGDIVVLAAGAWTASAFPELGPSVQGRCVATGQSVATIQLTPASAAPYRDAPVFLDFDTGFYVFPPNPDNIVKFALHAAGHTYVPDNGTSPNASVGTDLNSNLNSSRVSTPRTIFSHPAPSLTPTASGTPHARPDGLRIPRTVVHELREHLRAVYPALADMEFAGTRLCWYTDSPDNDWVIGRVPGAPSLVLATSGSGHAFKFLPIIGSIVADAIEGTLDPIIARKFAVDRAIAPATLAERDSRPVSALDEKELCSPEDLLPVRVKM